MWKLELSTHSKKVPTTSLVEFNVILVSAQVFIGLYGIDGWFYSHSAITCKALSEYTFLCLISSLRAQQQVGGKSAGGWKAALDCYVWTTQRLVKYTPLCIAKLLQMDHFCATKYPACWLFFGSSQGATTLLYSRQVLCHYKIFFFYSPSTLFAAQLISATWGFAVEIPKIKKRKKKKTLVDSKVYLYTGE